MEIKFAALARMENPAMCADSIIRSVWLASILLIAAPIFAQESEKKLPVPSDAAQAQAMKLVKELYGDFRQVC